MSRPIRDHQRAAAAHRHVDEVAGWADADMRKAYKAVTLKLPALVHGVGLAPALHHVAALSKGEKGTLLDHLAEQLADGGLLGDKASRSTLLAATRDADLARLQALTRETLRCLDWYRRLVKTMLKTQTTREET